MTHIYLYKLYIEVVAHNSVQMALNKLMVEMVVVVVEVISRNAHLANTVMSAYY
jgi:hypothetical protein